MPQVCQLTDDKLMGNTNPVNLLKHANAEVEAAHIHSISPFPFPWSHLGRGLGPAWHTGAVVVDLLIVVSISLMSSIYKICLSERLNGLRRSCQVQEKEHTVQT